MHDSFDPPVAARLADVLKASSAAQEQAQRFRAALDNLPDGLAIFDALDRFVFWNARYPEHVTAGLRAVLELGKPFHEWLREGDALEPIYHADMGPDFLERRLRYRGQEGTDHEQHIADGRWIRIREQRTADGGRILVTSDVTERRRQSEALAEQTRKLEAVLGNIDEAVTILDTEGRIVLVNRGFLELYDYPAELAEPGTPVAEFIRWRLERGDRRPDEPDQLSIDEIVAERRAYFLSVGSSQTEDVRPDGRIIAVRRQRLPDGYLLSAYRDITELRRRQQTNALLATAVEASGDSVEIADADIRLQYVNPAFTRLTGYAADEALGRKPGDFLRSDEHDDAFFAEIEQTIRQGDTWRGRLVSRHRDGGPIVQDAVISAVRGPEGFSHFVAVKRDIGEQERAALALRASEERYRAVIEAQSEFIVRQTPDGRLSFVNDAYCRHIGLPRARLLDQIWDEVVPVEEGAQAAWDRHHAALTPERPVGTVELPIVLPDGRAVWEQWTSTAIFDETGRLIEYQAVGRDVTEAHQMAEALRTSEQRFRTMVEDQSEFITRFGPDLVLTFANQAYARQLGRSQQAMVGMSLLELMNTEQEARFRRQLATLTPDRPTVTYEMDAVRADGSSGVELWTDRGLFDAAGRLVEYQSVGRDITEEKRAETDLRESEARFRAIAEAVPLPLAISRADMSEMVFANERALEIYAVPPGAPREAILGVWAHPQERLDIVSDVQRYGRVDNREVQLRRPDGSTFWGLVSARAMDWAGGPAILTVSADITERRRMEEAVRESEARLAAFLENAPVGMYLKGEDGRYLLANPEMSKVFGRPADEMIGRLPTDSLAGHDFGLVKREDQAVMARGAPSVVEEHAPDLDAYAWSMVIRFPIRGPDGAVGQIGGFHVDITRQKLTEQRLGESEARFRAIAEANPVAMTIVRMADREPVFANRPFMELFHLRPADLTSKSFSRLYVDRADRGRLFDRLRRDGGVENYEIDLKRTDGSPFPASLTSRAIEYEGAPAVVTGVIDLSDKRAAQAEIARQREALHQSEKMSALGNLLAGVAHELNNPLSVVVGQATILEEVAPDAPVRERAAKIHAAAERCARIVKTFLAMARSKPRERGPVDLNQTVEAALELLAYGLRTTDVEIVRAYAKDLPPVWGDSDQLHQVFANLIVNAQHALAEIEGGRRLRLTSRAVPGAVEVEVRDNGPGIPPEIAKRIFEPFFTTKPVGGGTGIGLSVSHGIVDAHGGRITVKSRPGAGSRFTVRLPTADSTQVGTAERKRTPAKAARGRVLIVDDEPDVAELYAEILARAGFETRTAASGREALAVLAGESVDAVVSDLRMPDLDGPGLHRRIAATRPELARCMLFVTGDTLAVELRDFLAETGLGVIEKPIDAAELVRRVRAQIGRA